MSNAEECARGSKRSPQVDSCPTLQCVSGANASGSYSTEKYSGPSYYPEIAPLSPHFVGTTFYCSHTMMEATKQLGLIASSEARIVDPRRATNRLSQAAFG